MKQSILFICSLAITAVMQAQVIHIPGDYDTIQQAINAASPGDTILVADGLYYENINFMGKKPLLLASYFFLDGDTNHINNTIINGSQPVDPDLGSVVTFTSGEDTTSVLCGFTITGGSGNLVAGIARAGGGVFIQYSGGKLLNNHIEYNTVKDPGWANGGGITAGGPISHLPWVVIRNNRITGNKAISTINDFGEGGGVVCFYNAIMTDNVVSGNEAIGVKSGQGGGVYQRGDFGASYCIFKNNIVTNNKAITNSAMSEYSLGGGFEIWLSSGIISGNVFSGNYVEAPAGAESDGSGVFIQEPTLNDLVFENNFVVDNTFGGGGDCYGGGLSLWISGGTYLNNVIQNNADTKGGGIFIGNSPSDTAILINNTVTGNDAAGFGTGLHISSSNAVVINSILYNNTPPGPAIYAESSDLQVVYSDVDVDEYVYPGEGNINCEPAFLEDGYHLDPGCQLVNAGIASIDINGVTYSCPDFDIDGEPRPYGPTQPEIGADEIPFAVSVNNPLLSNNTGMIAYPNPARDFVIISLPMHAGTAQLTLFNTTGERLLETQITRAETRIDISALPQGVYFVRVQNAGMMKVEKIMKE